MNSITTNPCTNISAFLATLNATLNTKDHALYSYGFVWMEGTSGDPRYGESGVLSGGYYTDLGEQESYFFRPRLKENTAYRVAALAVDGTTFEFFYGDTIDLVTPEFVHTPFTGTVKIEDVTWEGLVVTVGEGKEFPSLLEATEYVNSLEVPCVYIIYSDFENVDDSYFRNDAYVVGVGAPVITLKGDTFGRSGFELLQDLTKFYVDNIYIVVDSSLAWNRRLVEDWNGGLIKFNKVQLEVLNDGLSGSDLVESCSTPTLDMQNVTLNCHFTDEVPSKHINIPAGANESSVLSKIAYNEPWTAVGLDVISVDRAVIGTDGYGYDYGTAGALIEVTEASEPPSTFIPSPMIF
jgi:hypothetical protein